MYMKEKQAFAYFCILFSKVCPQKERDTARRRESSCFLVLGWIRKGKEGTPNDEHRTLNTEVNNTAGRPELGTMN